MNCTIKTISEIFMNYGNMTKSLSLTDLEMFFQNIQLVGNEDATTSFPEEV